MANVNDFKIVKDRKPQVLMEKKLKKYGYDIKLNDYIQMYPKDIHLLSKHMADAIEQNKNITFSFDQEVKTITKQKNIFTITTDEQEYQCKKIILAAGRSGWRWTRDIFNNFGVVDNNDTAQFGIRIEMNSNFMREFNKSNCSIFKNNDLELGPISWYGTIIPEDHLDMAISCFRSNENRWKSDKVSFNLIGNRPYPNKGFEQTDRIGKLTFVITNDRIIKEKVSHIITGKSKISILPDYNWLKDTLVELSSIVPEILTKAYYHAPTIIPLAPKINIGSNLETEIDNMFVIGESAGIPGILSAGIMGISVADFILK